MAEDYPEVRNFWDDFNNAYYEWASENGKNGGIIL